MLKLLLIPAPPSGGGVWCDIPDPMSEPPLTRWHACTQQIWRFLPPGQSLLRCQPVCLWHHYKDLGSLNRTAPISVCAMLEINKNFKCPIVGQNIFCGLEINFWHFEKLWFFHIIFMHWHFHTRSLQIANVKQNDDNNIWICCSFWFSSCQVIHAIVIVTSLILW